MKIFLSLLFFAPIATLYSMQYEKIQQEQHFSFQERRAIKRMFKLLHDIDETNEKQKLEHIRWLLQQYPVILNARDDEGRTPLIIAARQRGEEVVRFLIGQHALLDLQDEHGTTALMSAAANGDSLIVKRLIDAGASLNKRNNKGWVALMHAVASNTLEAVRLLIEARANVNKHNNEGMTALMYATLNKNMKMIKLLVAAGAELDLSSEHDTAFSIAKENEYEDIYCTAVKAGQEERESYQKRQLPIRKEIEEHLIPVLADITQEYLFSIIPGEFEAEESPCEPKEPTMRGNEVPLQHSRHRCVVQ